MEAYLLHVVKIEQWDRYRRGWPWQHTRKKTSGTEGKAKDCDECDEFHKNPALLSTPYSAYSLKATGVLEKKKQSSWTGSLAMRRSRESRRTSKKRGGHAQNEEAKNSKLISSHTHNKVEINSKRWHGHAQNRDTNNAKRRKRHIQNNVSDKVLCLEKRRHCQRKYHKQNKDAIDTKGDNNINRTKIQLMQKGKLKENGDDRKKQGRCVPQKSS